MHFEIKKLLKFVLIEIYKLSKMGKTGLSQD